MIKHPVYVESEFFTPLVIEGRKNDLIDPSNTLFRYNDGSILITGSKIEVINTGNEIAGYLIPINQNDEYVISFVGVSTMQFRQYESEPTGILDTPQTGGYLKSGTVMEIATTTTHVLLSIYAADYETYPKTIENIKLSKRVMPSVSGGAIGSFTSTDGKTVTVENGHIISIV